MRILTHDQLHRTAPAIFASQPDDAVSDRYGFVPTINVVDALQAEGWYPVRAQQTNVRQQARRDVARHMIRFRQDPDRSAAFQLDLGLFRLICLNGMVTPVGDVGGIRVRHGKQIVDEILEGSIQLSHQVPRIAEGVEAFQSTLISRGEAQLFAESALSLRYGDDWQANSPIQPTDVLEARRSEDANGSLWSVFNRTQENLFKGGLRGRSPSGRATRTRPINSVTEDVRLNRALWKLTERFAELKGADLAA